MHKMSLLVVVLSVCALHAADEKREEEVLLMEQIKEVNQLMSYVGRVIAYTTTIYNLHHGDDGFTFEPSKENSMARRFGIVKLCSYMNNPLAPIKRQRDDISICSFLKNDAIASEYLAGRALSTEVDGGWSVEWDVELRETFAGADLNVRFATQEEKIKIKEKLLDGGIKLGCYSKEKALAFLSQ